MRGKIVFVVGLATGYVLGTRAGRERYEQIKAGADKVWNTPAVQSGVDKVQEFAGARVDAVKADLSVKVRRALGALIGREPSTSASSSRAAASVGSTRATPAKSAAGSSAKPAGGAKSGAAGSAATSTASTKPAGKSAADTADDE
ncbi:YtxH domain-containing protein [Herbiconiux sp. YIM B11900]|uniref:YtxH domain-containing protein n=1 Tax=Herbiconiux sp. YIM B11900 TaxID=3404131 RepID=UPI003F839A16